MFSNYMGLWCGKFSNYMGHWCSTESNYMGGWLAQKRQINVFDVPTCPTISPVVGHSIIVGPLLSTWGNCRKQIPAILDNIKFCGWCLRKLNSIGGWVKKSAPPPPPTLHLRR